MLFKEKWLRGDVKIIFFKNNGKNDSNSFFSPLPRVTERRSKNPIEALSDEDVFEALSKGYSLQIHCDGGFCAGAGAAAFVVHIVEPRSNQISRAGYKGVYLAAAVSAFQAEVTAIDLATKFVKNTLEVYRDKRMNRKRGIEFVDI